MGVIPIPTPKRIDFIARPSRLFSKSRRQLLYMTPPRYRTPFVPPIDLLGASGISRDLHHNIQKIGALAETRTRNQ